MVQFVVAVAVVAAGVGVAALIRRRDRKQMTRGDSWSVPAQLDRADFNGPDARQLIVVFSSDTCDACAATWQQVKALEGPDLAVQEVSYQLHQDLHDRYGIDAVPTLVIADAQGVVKASFVGPPNSNELAEALATANDH